MAILDKPGEAGSKLFGVATEARQGNSGSLSALAKGVPGIGGAVGAAALSKLTATEDPMWVSVAADDIAPNWDKHFPYQLLLLENKAGNYVLSADTKRFTLPMPPQQLTISTVPAVNLAVTMGGGVHIEHNGAPLREISLSGTTGVLPLKGTAGVLETLSAPEAVFAGALRGVTAIGNTISQARNLFSGFEGREAPNVIPEANFNPQSGGLDGQGTGFYQFHLLQRFLESYWALRKTGTGTKYRLAFAIWKDSEVYLVEPRNFTRQRSAASPFEYRYTLSLTGYRRISLTNLDKTQGRPYTGHLASKNPNILAQVRSGIDTARRVISNAQSVITGFKKDVAAVYSDLRDVSAAVGESLGLALSLAELPSDIVDDLSEAVLETAFSPDFAFQSRAGGVTEKTLKALEKLKNLAQETQKSSTDSGNLTSQKEPALEGDNQSHELLSMFSVSSLNIRPETQNKINRYREKVSLMNRFDFERIRNDLGDLSASFAQSVGVGDATASRVLGIDYTDNVEAVKDEPSDEDWEIIDALETAVASMDYLVVSTDAVKEQPQAMDYVAGLASRSGIAFTTPRSKFSVPFPYGYTLEQLSRQYLGDADRWMEIASLNGLRAPYVDEIGWQKPLLTNGAGNSVVVASSENLYTGQQIWIGSSTVGREKRRITKIEQVGLTYVVTLTGDADLNRYAAIANAFIQGYLPDTVNSQQTIYIPSQTESEDGFRDRQIPGVDYFDPMVRSGGVSILLDADGDIVVGSDGKTRLAVGLTNAIQRVKTFFATPLGSVLRHPTYGNPIRVGSSVSDTSAKEILGAINGFFTNDKTFSGVSAAAVSIDGNTARIRVNVGMKATGNTIPVEFQMPR